MGKPRIRFREFLLMTTLASLLSATWAIRARVSYGEAAQRHTMRAIQIRANRDYWQSRIDLWEGKVKAAANRLEEAEARAGLREVRAAQAREIDEAEHHERLARLYGP
jgi:hypothetical protein